MDRTAVLYVHSLFWISRPVQNTRQAGCVHEWPRQSVKAGVQRGDTIVIPSRGLVKQIGHLTPIAIDQFGVVDQLEHTEHVLLRGVVGVASILFQQLEL